MRGMVHANGDRASYLDLCIACTWEAGEAAVGDDESSEVTWFPGDALTQMRAALRQRIDDALADEPTARFNR
jgi:hypothetical protein